MLVARFARVFQHHRAALHGILQRAHNQAFAEFFGIAVAKIRDFAVIVTGVDVQ